MKAHKFSLLLSLITAVWLQTASAVPATGSKVSASPKNVVLVVIDTLRSDALPFYGYNEDTAPYFTHLANKGAVMENNFSTSSWTAPGTASIHTALYPFQHGVVMGRSATRRMQKSDPKTKLNRIPEEVTTLAEVLKGAGFETFGVADNGNIREDAGFAQGFSKFRTFTNEGAENVTDTINEWAPAIKAAARHFVYLQFMDPHHPYKKRKPWFDKPDAKGSVNRLKAAYDSEIRFVDEHFKALSEKFGWENNALIVLTSDHGEEFRDHDGMGHGKTLFSEVVRVPFMVYSPDSKIAGTRLSKNTSTVDILPTIADKLNILLDFHHEGKSIYKLKEQKEERLLYTHLWKQTPEKEVHMYGVSDGTHRFVFQDGQKDHKGLYNIVKDPGEQENLLDTRKDIALELKDKYLAFEKSAKRYKQAWADTNLVMEAKSE